MRRITLRAFPLLALACVAMAAELPWGDLPGPPADQDTITCYVAPDGNDSNPGTIEQPFATLLCARNALRLAGSTRARRIIIRGGDFYGVALVLEAQDSGLTIQAATGEKPILHGGVRVTRWAKDGDRFYAADLPGVKEHRWDFRSLVVEGELRPRARLPVTGKFTHLTRFDAHWESTVGGGFRGADLPETKLQLKYRPGDLGAWLDPNNAELTIYHMWDESMVGVKSHDPATQTLTFSSPSGFPPGAFGVNTYVVWNLREGMQQPGNWYLDRSRGKVVYWPRAGEEINRVEVVAPSVQSIIELHGTELEPVAGITIKGLKLTATNTPLMSGGWAAGAFKGAVEASFAQDCVLSDLQIVAVGGQAVRIAHGSRNRISGCEITDIGAGGIYDSDGSATKITDNRVSSVGKIYSSAIGLSEAGTSLQHPELSHDNDISNNEVSDGPYVGILFNGLRNVIQRNLVHHVMQVLADGAAIYGGGKDIVIRENIVRDLPAEKTAHGFYIDELGTGCLIEANLSVNCSWPLHMHMASDNTIRNNVFISEGGIKLTFEKCRGFELDRNIIVAGGAIRVENPDEVTTWSNNLFFSRTGHYEQVPEVIQRADPLFVRTTESDFDFQPQSPARGLGIKPLRFPAVGPRSRPISAAGSSDSGNKQ